MSVATMTHRMLGIGWKVYGCHDNEHMIGECKPRKYIWPTHKVQTHPHQNMRTGGEVIHSVCVVCECEWLGSAVL